MGDGEVEETGAVGPVENLFGVVAGVRRIRWKEVRLFGEVEILELRQSAVETDIAFRDVDKVERNKSPQLIVVFWCDDEVGNCLSDRVDNDAAQFPTDPVSTEDI